MPDSAQRAVGIAGDIRDLAITVSVDTGVWTKDLAANLTLALVDELPDLSDRMANFQLPDWWPCSTGEIALPTNAPPHVAGTFGAAKQTLYERIYADHRATFYCGCRFDRGTEVSLSLSTSSFDRLSGSTRAPVLLNTINSCSPPSLAILCAIHQQTAHLGHHPHPDPWEIARDRRIKAVQDMGNAYVDAYRKL